VQKLAYRLRERLIRRSIWQRKGS